MLRIDCDVEMEALKIPLNSLQEQFRESTEDTEHGILRDAQDLDDSENE